ncbi:hypothetical protein [Gemmobacter sp. 24YEA27]|uniref:hypothetical protein n=1 Tax=Gemmobacter sp. 24YEA27 TaxID=3040672 RepID=UPI0024B33F5D|nr:hypothetical protein [Gemmobacter sp. 24YEA27]
MVRLLTLILALLVLPLAAGAEAGLKLSILRDGNGPQPVVGEMIPVIIRAVYDYKIANEKLEITPSTAFDWIQTHPDDWHEERIDGLPKIVMERRLALWPKRAGPLQFGPVRHQLTIINKQSQREDALVVAPPLMLSVGEFPALKGWHFAASEIDLTEELSTDPAHLADGETVTRVIRLRVVDALPEQIPPRPVVSENWLITFAAPTRRELIRTETGPETEVIWSWQFRPHTGEPGVLEPVKIPWFNTRSRRIETVEIPALTIGYASFYTGQVPRGQIGTGQALALAAMVALGLALGSGLAAWRLRPDRSGQALRRLRARYAPLALIRRWQAWRKGDLLTLRRLLGEAGAAPERLARLDSQIYGRPPQPPASATPPHTFG